MKSRIYPSNYVLIGDGSTYPDTITAAALAALLDHGTLSGLADDDHTQYLLIDGTRAMTGNLLMPSTGVFNFGSGDLTITHSSGKLTYTGQNYFTGTVTIGTATATGVSLTTSVTLTGTGSGEYNSLFTTSVNNASGAVQKSGIVSNMAMGSSYAGTGGTAGVVSWMTVGNAVTHSGEIRSYESFTNITAAATIGSVTGYRVVAVGNSGGATVTNNTGLLISAQTVGTNIYGIRSQIAAASGRYNLYIDGGADNYFGGKVTIGHTAATGKYLSVFATLTDTAAERTIHNQTAVANTSGTGAKFGIYNWGYTNAGYAGTGEFILHHAVFTQLAAVTVKMVCYNAALGTSAAGTISYFTGYNHQTQSNAGGATVTTNTGFNVAAQTVGTSIYGFRSQIASSSGRYNLYIDGTADNYLAGNTAIGTTPSSTFQLHVFRSATATGAADYAIRAQINVSNASGSNNKIGINSYVQVNTPFGGTNVLYGVATDFVLNHTATVATYVGLSTVTLNTAAAGTVTSLVGLNHPTQANAGGATITTHTGIQVSAQTVGSTIYGIRSQIAAASGRYNLYIDGTANNYIAGTLTIGTTADTGAAISADKTDSTTSAAQLNYNIFRITSASGSANKYNTVLNTRPQGGAHTGNVYGMFSCLYIPDINVPGQYASYASLLQITQAVTLSNTAGYVVETSTNSGGATVTLFTGLLVKAQTVGTTIYGIRSQIASTSGRYNLYIDGTADNYIAGNIEFGHLTDTTLSRASAGDVNIEGNIIYRAGGTDVPVADGGSGRSTATAYAVLCGGTTSTAAHQSIASVGTSGQVLTSNGAGALPTFQDATGGSTNFRKNVIINGDMAVWQRGTSFTGITGQQFAADRWQWNGATDGVVSYARSTSVPTVAQAGRLFNYSALVTVTTLDSSIGASQYALMRTAIEGYQMVGVAQQDLVLSFWVKGVKTGTHCVAILNSGADRSFIAEYTIDSANTWEFKTIAVTASPSAGTWDYTTGVGFNIYFALACGSTYHGSTGWNTGTYFATSNQVNAMDSTSNNWSITGVQLEVDDGSGVATEFELEPYETQLARCQRYCFAQTAGDAVDAFSNNGYGISTTQIALWVPFPVTMRASPSFTVSSATHCTAGNGTDAIVATSLTASSVINERMGSLLFNCASGATQHRPYFGYFNSTSGYLWYEAEL